jgi:hypothetical protein
VTVVPLATHAAGVTDNWISLKGDAAVFVNRSVVATEVHADPLRVDEPTRWLECLHCNQKVTKTSDRVEVDGKHLHSFINPAGVIYRIGCFGSAVGVVEVGEASAVFTWFAGNVWRVALCVGCERHLGWGFHGGESQFYGLVLAELKGPDLLT